MVETISHQKAYGSTFKADKHYLWNGYYVFSRDGKWIVYRAGNLYKRKPCKPLW